MVKIITIILLLNCNNFNKSYKAKSKRVEAILSAISEGSIYTLEVILETRHLNMCIEGTSLINKAVGYGNEEIVKFLINKGSDINKMDENGWTPLTLASTIGDRKIAKFLINRGANIDFKNSYGDTALTIALKQEDKGLINILNPNNIVPCFKENNSKIIATQENINLMESNLYNRYPTELYLAAQKGDITSIKLAIRNGVNVNEKDRNNSYTPIMIASTMGHNEIVKLLISKGANVNAKDKYGQTALYRALIRDHKEIVKQILQQNTYNFNDSHFIFNKIKDRDVLIPICIRMREYYNRLNVYNLFSLELAINKLHKPIFNFDTDFRNNYIELLASIIIFASRCSNHIIVYEKNNLKIEQVELLNEIIKGLSFIVFRSNVGFELREDLPRDIFYIVISHFSKIRYKN